MVEHEGCDAVAVVAGDAISSFSLHDLTAYLNAPQAPSGKLGWGAGLETPASGNYSTTPAR